MRSNITIQPMEFRPHSQNTRPCAWKPKVFPIKLSRVRRWLLLLMMVLWWMIVILRSSPPTLRLSNCSLRVRYAYRIQDLKQVHIYRCWRECGAAVRPLQFWRRRFRLGRWKRWCWEHWTDRPPTRLMLARQSSLALVSTLPLWWRNDGEILWDIQRLISGYVWNLWHCWCISDELGWLGSHRPAIQRAP